MKPKFELTYEQRISVMRVIGFKLNPAKTQMCLLVDRTDFAFTTTAIESMSHQDFADKMEHVHRVKIIYNESFKK